MSSAEAAIKFDSLFFSLVIIHTIFYLNSLTLWQLAILSTPLWKTPLRPLIQSKTSFLSTCMDSWLMRKQFLTSMRVVRFSCGSILLLTRLHPKQLTSFQSLPLLGSALLPEEITWFSPLSTPAPADKAPLCNIPARCVCPPLSQRSWQECRLHLLLSWGRQRRLNVLKSPRIYPVTGSPHYFCSRVVKMIVEAAARMTQSAAIMLFCVTDGGDTQMTRLKKK